MTKNSVSIYCNFRQPGGVERVSVRLNDLLNKSGIESMLVSRNGDDLYSLPTSALKGAVVRHRVLIFSRKRDIMELGLRSLMARRLVYWRHIPFIQDGIFSLAIEFLFVAIISRIGHVVAVCDELAGQVKRVPLAAPHRVSGCYSPVGIGEGKTVEIRKIKDLRQVHLVYFGREGNQKKISTVISLVNAANDAGVGVMLSVFGYSKPPEDTPDSPHIRFLGRTDNPIGELSNSDGIILLSEYEGFPTALMEASLTGAPIFCNNFQTGLNDFEDLIGPTNRIVEEDKGSLARAIRSAKTGFYRFEKFTDEEILNQWQYVLNISEGSIE